MKKLLVCLSILVLASCGGDPVKTETNTKNQDEAFDGYKERFVLRLWELYPGWASSQGYHKYDSVLTIPNQEQRNKELAFCQSHLDSLKAFDLSALSDNNKTDYHMIEGQLHSTQWYINEYKSYEWNPSDYNVCGSFAEMLANNYDSLDTRLRHFYLRMKNVKAYYETAKQQIKNPTVEHTQLAIDQNLGGASTFDSDLISALDKSHLDAKEKEQILARASEVKASIGDYAKFLKDLKNETPRSFRLGKELYAKKFEHDIQSSYTAKEIYQKALEHKTELHAQMFALTKELWPAYLKDKKMPEDKLVAIKQMIDVLSVKHVAADSFQTEIEHQIPRLVNFIKEKDLIYIDPSKPLVIRKEPAYMAGVAGASISSPGPYDKNGNTYYNVGSFAGWDKAQIESYLREYNHYILQILNIHEAIPGHYTQLVYSNQSPSIIKSIFGNGAMVEGWAVYTERMMLENGYGNNPSTGSGQASKEMWLMYFKWNLRSTCNTILDYGVHVNNLSKEEAMHLLVDEAFQQKAEAEGKWKRVSVTQVQLCSYFTGFKEIYDFREELKKKGGKKFNLKQFHEKFLSYGSAPVKYIKELMNK
ncbi:MAG: hypothetical protein K0S53_2471 [Bacteroidetes bacterium]|jgi:uncharacterized protein (DUF885 family)|nr:hypothetical protein [Bacteroidota bacterium]MDF2450909.1 hypothetical protein [Bacteroidota bacterium]